MRDAGGHLAILVAAGTVACVISVAVTPRKNPEPAEQAPVVTLPTPPAKSDTRAEGAPSPADTGALARRLQSELKRVGCYDGEINGMWTTSSRLAMQTFTERVNARLPIDKPDPILLSLVQGERNRVCISEARLAKPPAQALAAPPESAAPAPPAVAAAAPIAIPFPVPVPVPAAPLRVERGAGAPLPAAAAPNPSADTASGPAPKPSASDEQRARRAARRASSRQIAYARAMFRSLQRAAVNALPRP